MTAPANLDELYRIHAPAMTASLARGFGAHRLDVIEAGVQEAFVAAMEQWRDPITLPDEPGAWLHTVARRKVLDALRRAAWFAPHGERELDALEAPLSGDPHGDDALLAMMFVCCHPALPVESALALALRTLCGFPIPALCRALYADESAVEKRLARARQTLRDEAVDFELDAETLTPADLESREDAVLRTLYILFLEGYSVHAGAQQVDADLCRAAIRQSELLVTRRPTPRAHALHALFLLQGSRLAARTDAMGELVPLDRQDRSLWDRSLIALGLEHLAAAATLEPDEPLHQWNVASAMKSAERGGGCYLTLRKYLGSDDRSDGARERLAEARRFVRGYETMLQHAHPSVSLGESLRGEALFAEAHAALDEGRADEARLAFEAVLRLQPMHHPSWAHLGSAFVALGMRGDALGCLKRALELAPGYAPAVKQLLLIEEPS